MSKTLRVNKRGKKVVLKSRAIGTDINEWVATGVWVWMRMLVDQWVRVACAKCEYLSLGPLAPS